MFHDFRIETVCASDDLSSVEVKFIPTIRFLIPIIRLFRSRPRMSLLSTIRLVNIASIIGAGLYLKKERKNGEVIVRDFQVTCKGGIAYDWNSRIKVKVEIADMRESTRFHIYNVRFEVGDSAQHHGSAKYYYCKPNSHWEPS